MKINVLYNKTQGRNNLAFCYYQKLEIRYKILLIMPLNPLPLIEVGDSF